MSLQFKSKFVDNKTDPFHEYFDIQVVHKSTDNQPTQLKFNQTRNAPYLMCPEKYFMSIVRFQVSTQLPVLIPEIKLNQTDPNKTNYILYIYSESLNKTAKINVSWVTQSLLSPPASPPGGFQSQLIDRDSDYYFCYSVQYFLSLINEQVTTELVAQGFTGSSVYFTFDASTANFKLNIIKSSGEILHVYINSALEYLFQTFSFYQTSAVPVVSTPINQVYAKEIKWQYINGNLPTSTSISVETDTSPLSNWNPVSKILFTTTTLPVFASLESEPKVYGTTQRITQPSSNNDISTILTDFIVNVGQGSSYNPNTLYVPTAEYRLNDMYGNSPLSNIDLEVWWADKYNNLYKLLIPSGGSGSIKLMFRLKSFNTSDKNIIV